MLLQDRVGEVLVLTLNRPDARNALNPQLMNALNDSLRAAIDDDDVRVAVLTGEPIDAARAMAVGLVNRVVPGDQVLDVAVELASKVAANGPLGVQVTKRLLRDAALIDPQRGWGEPDDVQLVFNSEDAVEGA